MFRIEKNRQMLVQGGGGGVLVETNSNEPPRLDF